MSKHLNHEEWVIHQFGAGYLKSAYRNVILHASIIEGTVRNNVSKKGNFYDANINLKNAGTITTAEYDAFEGVREVRNKLVHEIFKDGFNEDQILDLRDTVLKKIIAAYRISKFLDDKLFKKYGIPRLPKIEFVQPV